MLIKSRDEDAYQSFMSTRDHGSDMIESDAKVEYDALERAIIVEQLEPIRWKDFMIEKDLRKRAIFGYLTMYGAQGTANLVTNSEFDIDAHVAPVP